MSHTPRTSSKIITGTIGAVASLIAIYGGWLFISSSHLISSSAGKNLAEDDPHAFDGFTGLFGQILGLILLVVAGLVAILFIVAYFKVRHDYATGDKNRQAVIKPAKH